MKLLYWQGPDGNFGDDLNVWLWDYILPGWQDWDSDRWLVGVGSILNGDLLPKQTPLLVVGSGAGYGALPQLYDDVDCDIRCVRGPKTARALQLDETVGVVDPAVMVSQMPEFQNLEKSGETVFVPYWQSVAQTKNNWSKICKQAGVSYISPLQPAREVIREIACADRVIAESMHAAIIADAFRVPWVAVQAHPSFNHFKWMDWASSVGLSRLEIHDLYSSRDRCCVVEDSLVEKDHEDDDNIEYVRDGVVKLLKKNALLLAMVRARRCRCQSRQSIRNLQRLKGIEPALSDEKVLNKKIGRFKQVLEQIHIDYA